MTGPPLLRLILIFHSVADALVLIFPTIYAMSGGLLLQWLLHLRDASAHDMDEHMSEELLKKGSPHPEPNLVIRPSF
jgi:hypothetical protein